MNWKKLVPWKFFVRRFALRHGFLDPFVVLARLRHFAQPSEVGEPIELLRAGFAFHARGLLNTKAIQNNMDWIWPYWVRRQFDPKDPSFVPRAFSITHVNLSHRNWTAVGLPDSPYLPIVDPAGMVTPFFDGWSLDAWILDGDEKTSLLPSRLEPAQRLEMGEDGLAVITVTERDGFFLESRAEAAAAGGAEGEGRNPVLRLTYRARSDKPALLALAVRPVNPEGVASVREIALREDRQSLRVNGANSLRLSEKVDDFLVSDYRRGDVFHLLLAQQAEEKPFLPRERGDGQAGRKLERDYARDKVELATAAALFRLEPGRERQVALTVELSHDTVTGSKIQTGFPPPPAVPAHRSAPSWKEALAGGPALRLPDEKMVFLFDSAVRTLILHSWNEVVPGPYTYKRFWFRDAAFILDGLLALNMEERVGRTLASYPELQTATGYFLSQEGEWDSNGEALWIWEKYHAQTGIPVDRRHADAILRGARWIARKRIKNQPGRLEQGLLPAGFSAEHLGVNDFYYWDDFWGVAGLEAAERMLRSLGMTTEAEECRREAERFDSAIRHSLERAFGSREPALPASPYRRMDAGAVGSLAVSYPLSLWDPRHPRLLGTAEWLHDNCLEGGGFFQDMIHSGINAYLTLHLAQVFLRAGDLRFGPLLRRVADLASPTGQWPEAIHPHTLGGCMGDGQHVWAAAEWVLMMRNLFLREEGETLILGSGLLSEWLVPGASLSFGPTLLRSGKVTVSFSVPSGGRVRAEWKGHFRARAPKIEIRLPGREPVPVSDPRAGFIEF